MKKVIFSFAILAAMLTSACSNENDPNGDFKMPEEGIPARLTLNLPTGGSRSATVTPDDNTNSDAGFEVGQDFENKINSVLIVLAKHTGNDNTPQSFEFIAAAQADATANNSTEGAHPKFTVHFKSQAIIDNAEKEVFVFAYCNPNVELIREIETKNAGDQFTDLIYTLTDGDNSTIWTKNSFLMTNRDLTDQTLPTLEEMNKSDRQNPIDLGTVTVQRVTARFDFEQTTVTGQDRPNLYPVMSVADETVKEGYVEILGMSLINEAKTFYYLPRMSADSTWTNPNLCERESTRNWVVGTEYEAKRNYTSATNTSSMFFYPTSVPGFAPGAASIVYDSLSDLTQDDNDENWTPGAGTDYRIWRYASENTIPGINAQKHGISTGVIFKAKLGAETGSELEKMLQSKRVLYAYDGHIYGDKDQLKAAVDDAPSTTLADWYNTLFVADNLDSNGDLKKTQEDAFTIYRPDADGNYLCYYFYYNRHWDNGEPKEMGQMEFAVVRNNVYKLKIRSISEFGHPGDPGDDPDPEDPDDPDESPKTYFRLSVNVLPWVVRVNQIDF